MKENSRIGSIFRPWLAQRVVLGEKKTTSRIQNFHGSEQVFSWPAWVMTSMVKGCRGARGILNVVLHMYQRYLNGRIEETKTSFHLDPLEFQAMTVANGCFSAGSNNSLQTSTTLPEAI